MVMKLGTAASGRRVPASSPRRGEGAPKGRMRGSEAWAQCAMLDAVPNRPLTSPPLRSAILSPRGEAVTQALPTPELRSAPPQGEGECLTPRTSPA